MLLQVRNGKFVRVYPTKPGTFDCNPENINTIKLEPAQRQRERELTAAVPTRPAPRSRCST